MDREVWAERALAGVNGAVAAVVVIVTIGTTVSLEAWQYAVLAAQTLAHVALLTMLVWIATRPLLWPFSSSARASASNDSSSPPRCW